MKRTILLADDSPTIQRLVIQTFADADFNIVSVSNGDAAIRKFEDIQPQVVLADIYMPGKNGYEVCAYVKNHSERGATPVVLLVGAFDAFDEDTALKAGAAGHITKPFEPRALVDLVVSLLAPSPAEEPESATAQVGQAAPEPEAELEERKDPTADLLGLEELFKPASPEFVPATISVSDDEIERIADRVIQKLSRQVIESVAWDVVPDITTKILREELKRNP